MRSTVAPKQTGENKNPFAHPSRLRKAKILQIFVSLDAYEVDMVCEKSTAENEVNLQNFSPYPEFEMKSINLKRSFLEPVLINTKAKKTKSQLQRRKLSNSHSKLTFFFEIEVWMIHSEYNICICEGQHVR